MANVFDQFDQPQPAASGHNVFDQFDERASAPPPAAPANVFDKIDPPSEDNSIGPMPGFLEAGWQGLKRGLGDVGQSVSLDTNRAPETSPAASPLEWGDAASPLSRLAPKLSYRLSQGSPVMATGLAGMGAGSLVDPVIGSIVGGVGGAAVGAALQAIGPSFQEELHKTPQDPDGAWDRAVKHSAISGAASGAGWGSFGLGEKLIEGPLKHLAFQVFGAQPAISATEKVAQNAVEGDPLTQGVGRAAAEGAASTMIPAVAHLAFKGKPEVRDTAAENQDIILDRAQNHLDRANQYDLRAKDPNISPIQAKEMQDKADFHREAASYNYDRLQAPARIQQYTDAAKDAWDKAEQYEKDSAGGGASQAASVWWKQRASALEQMANAEGFKANEVPPMLRRGKLSETWINNIAPEMASEGARKADPLFAQRASALAQFRDSLRAIGDPFSWGSPLKSALNKGETRFNGWSREESTDFLSALEEGRPLPKYLGDKYPWLRQAGLYEKYRDALDRDFNTGKLFGSRAGYVLNYIGHVWKNPEAAADVFTPDRVAANLGPNWFQKPRTYDLIRMGEEAGLELATYNPQELVTQRLLSGAKMVENVNLLRGLKREGMAIEAENAPYEVKKPSPSNPNPWKPINGPDGNQWLLAPDVQALWHNAIEDPGLSGNKGLIGDTYRGWLKFKADWVPVKLGLSLFHPTHFVHIFGIHNLSRAVGETFGGGQQSLARRAVAIPEALFQSVVDPFLALPLPFSKGLPYLGKNVKEAWRTLPWMQTEQQKYYTKTMKEFGLSAQLTEELRQKAAKDLSDAWNGVTTKYMIPYHMARRVAELISPTGFFFEKWIPALKAAAVVREKEALLRRRPDLIDNPTAYNVAARTLGKSIDNRFGEMFYGGLFWNKTLKEASIASFLSLGWNLGFVRDFGGGMLSPMAHRLMDNPDPTRQLARDVSNKTMNMFLYAMTAGITNAMITKMVGGSDPEGWQDYVFPRIGGLNPDGSARRVTNPFFTREGPMVMKNIEQQQGLIGGLWQTIYHKMLFDPLVELWNNRDYFGSDIRDPHADMVHQIGQVVGYLTNDQLNPMSISGAKRQLQLSGKPFTTWDVLKQATDRDVIGPMMGFGPAPTYASKSPLQNQIDSLFGKYVAAEAKPYATGQKGKELSDARTQFMGARQKFDLSQKDGDAAGVEAARKNMREAATKLLQLGNTANQIMKLNPGETTFYKFSRLPIEERISLLKEMQPEEFRQYFGRALQQQRSKFVEEAVKDSEVVALARKYFRQ